MNLLPIAVTLTVALGFHGEALATPASWMYADAAIHPYTTQMTNQWIAAMDAADKAMADKIPADEMLKALEATETLHSDKIQVLKRHPDYDVTLQRQLGIRLKLVTLYANMGYMYGKHAARTKKAAPLTQPGGAYARLDQATAMLKTYAAIKGEGDADFQKMTAYIADKHKQVDSLASQLGAIGGAGTSVVPHSNTPISKGTEAYVAQWWKKLDQLEASLSGTDANAMARLYRSAEDHHHGWKGWMKTHSEYEAILARQETLHGKIAPKQIEAALSAAKTMAAKGKQEKDLNYFGPHGGPAQQLGIARKSLAEYIKLKGDADPEAIQMTQMVAAATKEIDAIGMVLKQAALASRKMPIDVYAGGDKASFKAQIIAHWRGQYPADKILAVRFFETNWTRETNWKTNATSIYKSDYSWLPAKVVVQTNSEIATIYPTFVNKQHQSGNQIVISGSHSGGGYSVEEMLMKNVKL